MLYGTPAIHVEDDQTDRIGLRTLILSQLWQPTEPFASQEELDAQKPNIPKVPGGVILIGEQTRRAGGAMRTMWTFEGINGDGKSVTFKQRNNSIDYWFEPGFSERNILRMPGIEDLLHQYGGIVIDGQVQWLPTIGANGASANGAVKSDNTAGQPNPMFGYESYFAQDGTYHFRYASTNLPAVQTAALIFETGSLPGVAPVVMGTDGSGKPMVRNWLGLPASYRRVGPVYEIEESYWLSPDSGWPTQIYDKAGAITPASLALS